MPCMACTFGFAGGTVLKCSPPRFILWNDLSPAKLLLEVKIPPAPFQAKSQERNFPQGGSRGPGVEPGGLCYTADCPAGPGGRGLLEEGGGIGNQKAGEGAAELHLEVQEEPGEQLNGAIPAAEDKEGALVGGTLGEPRRLAPSP